MKKKIMNALVFVFILMIPLIVSANTGASDEAAENAQTDQAADQSSVSLGLHSTSSILIEASTGKVLYESNAHERLAPASMTKIMTMLLIMEAIEAERISLTDQVLISPNAARMGGSQVFLEPGSKMVVEDLLKAIAIASANDASVAMAELIAGSHELFVTKMNERCTQLGCQNTNFVNAHGLDTENHYSTASDMALIARELLTHQEILTFTSIYEEHLNHPGGTSTWMVNTNRLIRFYDGMDGLKTGFTSQAGYCLTATAYRNNMRLISVVKNVATPNERTHDTVELLNYGFSNYKLKTILDTNHDLGQVEVINGKSLTVNIRLLDPATNLENINEERHYTYNIVVDEIKAPVNVGDIVGTLQVIENNEVISTHSITVTESVQRASIWDLYKRNFQAFLLGR